MYSTMFSESFSVHVIASFMLFLKITVIGYVFVVFEAVLTEPA